MGVLNGRREGCEGLGLVQSASMLDARVAQQTRELPLLLEGSLRLEHRFLRDRGKQSVVLVPLLLQVLKTWHSLHIV